MIGFLMIIVIARFRPHPDRRQDLITLLSEVQEASRRDDGCLNYGYYSEVVDPTSFIAVEEWRDREALDAHLRTPHVGRLISGLPELGDGRPEVTVHEVGGSSPMQLPG
jgi:quinol monooxygenase YgiN